MIKKTAPEIQGIKNRIASLPFTSVYHAMPSKIAPGPQKRSAQPSFRTSSASHSATARIALRAGRKGENRAPMPLCRPFLPLCRQNQAIRPALSGAQSSTQAASASRDITNTIMSAAVSPPMLRKASCACGSAITRLAKGVSTQGRNTISPESSHRAFADALCPTKSARASIFVMASCR